MFCRDNSDQKGGSSTVVAYAKNLWARGGGGQSTSQTSAREKARHHPERERMLGMSSPPLYIDERLTPDSSKNTQGPSLEPHQLCSSRRSGKDRFGEHQTGERLESKICIGNDRSRANPQLARSGEPWRYGRARPPNFRHAQVPTHARTSNHGDEQQGTYQKDSSTEGSRIQWLWQLSARAHGPSMDVKSFWSGLFG